MGVERRMEGRGYLTERGALDVAAITGLKDALGRKGSKRRQEEASDHNDAEGCDWLKRVRGVAGSGSGRDGGKTDSGGKAERQQQQQSMN